MRVAGVTIGRVGEADVEAQLAAAREAEVTYDHVGSTLAPERWPDRRPHRRQRVLGLGPEDYAAAVERLRAWAPQHHLGARLHPAASPVVEGATVLVELRKGPLAVIAPTRVVAVVDEPGRRFGFAYGTLPGHVEKGEEGFLVELQGDPDDPEAPVVATVSVDAALGTLAAKLGAPVVYFVQRWAVGRYLEALVVEP
jgi:uncharacterized protein (UPF0548 family)